MKTLKAIIAVLLFIVTTFSYAQELKVIEINDKYGYENKQGKIVISPIYDDAGEFSENLAAVEKDGKCGFIDKSGKTKIPFKYDDAKSFRDGFATINIGAEKSGFLGKLGGKWGVINISGKIIIPVEYDLINHIQREEFEFQAMKNKVAYYYNKKGKLVKTDDFKRFAKELE